MRVASNSIFVLALSVVGGVVLAADSVSIQAVSPTANEQGLVPGKVTINRTGADQPLVVRYRITGDTARSDKHGPYVANVTLPTQASKGGGYRQDFIPEVLVQGTGPTPPVVASFYAQGTGGFVSGIAVDVKGSEYAAAPNPGVTIGDTITVRDLFITNPGAGYASPPTVTIDPPSMGGVQAQANAIVENGRVTHLVITNGGSGYVEVPGVTFTGGSPTTSAQATAVLRTGMGASAVADLEAYVSRIDSQGNEVIAYRVGRFSSIVGGQGYTAPTVSVGNPPPPGITAQGTVTLGTSWLSNVSLVGTGYGYDIPSVSSSNASPTPAVLIAVVSNQVVTAVTVVSGGGNYGSRPLLSITGGGGSGAVAQATVVNGVITGVTVLHGGGGYSSTPSILATNEAVLRARVDKGVISAIGVESGGFGYPMPGVVVSDSGGTGSGALARVTVTGGRITGITLLNGGSGFTGVPIVTLTGPGAGASFSGSVANGQVSDLRVSAGGAGYTCPAIVISNMVNGVVSAAGVTPAVVEATVDNGAITAVTVLSGGSGYGAVPSGSVAVDDPTTVTEAKAMAAVLFANPDYVAPFGTQVDPVSGDMIGTITMPAGVTAYDIPILPLRNGVGGGRTVNVVIDPPLVAGGYIVDQRSSAKVAIADADEDASIVVNRPIAYPIPPAMDDSFLPVEVQGRAEWRIDVVGSRRLRDIGVQVQGDAALGPEAELGKDYVLAVNSVDLQNTVTQVVMCADSEKVPTPTSGPAKKGDTTIPIMSEWPYTIPSVVVIEYPGNAISLTNGYYTVSKATAGTATKYPTITITPGLRHYDCTAGVTRVRNLGQRLNTKITHTFDYDQTLYFFAFPMNPFDASLVPRGRRSIALNFIQTNDYRVLTPTVGSAVLADIAVQTGLRFVANGGQPSTNGSVEVVFSSAFPVDIDVPFYILGSSTAELGVQVSVTGVNNATRQGTVRVAAGGTTARIEVQPIAGSVQTVAKAIDISLLPSPDYQLVPAGTSPVNPTASVTITPAPKTTAGEDVYLSISTTQNAREPAVNGSVRISMTNAAGVALAGVLTQNLGVNYSATGSAVAGVNYQNIGGTAVIPAGQQFVDVPVTVIDDGRVTDDLSLVVSLTSGAGYQVSSQSNATVAILDAGPRIRVAATTATATRGGANGIFTVTNTRVVNRDTTVGYIVGGTAVVGTDYTALPGTVTIPSGQSTATIQVAALASATGATAASTVVVTLASDTAATTTYIVDSPSSDTVTIPAATPTGLVTSLGEAISYSVTAVSDAQKPSTNGVFRFYLSNSAGTALNGTATAPLSITYTIGGTAVAGSAYTALSGTAIITTGAKSVDVSVAPINNGTTGTTTVSVTIPAASWPSSVNTASLSIKDAGSTSAAAADPFRALPLAGGGGGSSGGCGLGSGLGLAILGGGLAVAMALRRRRR